jgi:hypothetical protein
LLLDFARAMCLSYEHPLQARLIFLELLFQLTIERDARSWTPTLPNHNAMMAPLSENEILSHILTFLLENYVNARATGEVLVVLQRAWPNSRSHLDALFEKGFHMLQLAGFASFIHRKLAVAFFSRVEFKRRT